TKNGAGPACFPTRIAVEGSVGAEKSGKIGPRANLDLRIAVDYRLPSYNADVEPHALAARQCRTASTPR
ncbi:MAG: hypothetical protein WCL32_23760, partial [Planctomycetota bacterium]